MAGSTQRCPALVTGALVEAGGLRVADVRCRAPAAPLGAEEAGASWRLVLPVRGVFTCQVRGASQVAEPGCAILLEPHEPYRFGHPVDGGDACVAIAPAPEVWRELTLRKRRVLPARRVVLDGRDLVRTALLRRAAAQCRDDPDAVRELAVLHLDGVVARFSAGGDAGSGIPASGQRAARDAAAFIAAHYPEPLPRLMDATAAAVGCSPFHLARVFRAVHGMTLHAYRERLRTAAAVRALADGADDLAALAVSLGYTSHSHFTDRFRRATGSPPSAVRSDLRSPHRAAGRTAPDGTSSRP